MGGMLLNACFAIWCLGSPLEPDAIGVIATQDVYANAGVENRLIALAGRWMIGGFVHQPDARDVLFMGTIPLRIQLHSRVMLEGGGVIATGELPRRGTIINWLARAQFRVTDAIAFEVVHLSNGGPRDIANPAIDSVGVSLRVRK
jgi:hypothetical protein